MVADPLDLASIDALLDLQSEFIADVKGGRDPVPLPVEGKRWPILPDAAKYGLAWDVVEAIAPSTEADLSALLFQFLIAFGAAAGDSYYAMADGARHGLNELLVLVGKSSRARKGSSWRHIWSLMFSAWPELGEWRRTGLSSGEGLVADLKDPADCTRLIIEPEFSSVLRVCNREGNILSETIRNLFDGDRVQTLTKHNPLKADRHHVAMVGHITREELDKCLTDTQAANGFGNRIMFAAVRRRQQLPDGGQAPKLDGLAGRVNQALRFARSTQGPVVRDPTASALWHRAYGSLTSDWEGLFGALVSRSEAHVLRLSLIFAALDSSSVVREEHLVAAFGCWKYVEDSARYVFGDRSGDPTTDRILEALAAGDLTRSELSGVLSRHVPAARLEVTLNRLVEQGKVMRWQEGTTGRPREVYRIPGRNREGADA